jgi:hypothetical protein
MSKYEPQRQLQLTDPQSFDVNLHHTVIYARPFGVTLKVFES